MKKISSKIILAIVVCSAIIALLVGSISIIKSSDVIQQEAYKKLLLMAENTANLFSQSVVQYECVVRSISITVSNSLKVDHLKNDEILKHSLSVLDPIIKDFGKNTAGAIGVYFVLNPELTGDIYQIWYADENENGNFKKQAKLSINKFTPDNPDMAWYYNPIKMGKGLWTLPFINPVTNKYVISYTEPIYIDNTLIGVAGIDVSFEKFRQAVLDIEVYDTGYAFLMNENYNFLAHPNFTENDNLKTIENGFFKSLAETIKTKHSGVIEYNYKGQDKILGYSHLANGHILAVTGTKKEALKEMINLRNLLLGLTITALILAAALGFILARTISKPLINLKEAFNKAALGDLTVKANIKSKDEVGEVGKGFNTMTEKLCNLIEKIASVSDFVNSASNQLSKASLDSTAVSEEISASIEEVASRANEQSNTMEKAASMTRLLSKEVVELGKMGTQVGESAQKTSQSAQEGKKAIEKIRNQMNQIQNTITETSAVVNELVNKSNKINEIVEIINRIANQTQLLALNAAIEAARAGEAGKGFAVVADEIKALAEETVTSAEEIGKLIKETQEETSKVNIAMEHGIKEVKAGNKVVETTSGIFDEIVSAAKDNLEFANKANTYIEKITDFSNQILEKIEEVAVIAQQTSASAEEVSASTEEQTATIEEISTSAEKLHQMAEELKQLIEQFKYK
ncbi:hypothetical protein BBF96_13990 [Anoxybacter fermentans]|uniref:Chemotaxis protein n=1 Tax=Anoxybacter fermentans TaxID=1323375 RepID=A0A3S9T1J5_9FIRM|nr:methyl-accepting chemotaxis protein [Anoxybacter fermentans]AZR74399.1 hypothetical protein BBF96_13990 [Anoxybacter fermentans]